jgi:hypothetical protein
MLIMKMYRTMIAWMAIPALAIGVVGCETTGESAGLGALVGAGAGALIGSTGGESGPLIGAAVGAAVGAGAGAVIHDVRKSRAEQVKPAAQTAEVYHYQPSAGQSLVFEDAGVQPVSARRGEFIEARMQYALLGAPGGLAITERRLILKNDKVISEISAEEHTRNDGTWVSTQQFRVPDSWGPGEYIIEQVVTSARLTVSGRARFRVE